MLGRGNRDAITVVKSDPPLHYIFATQELGLHFYLKVALLGAVYHPSLQRHPDAQYGCNYVCTYSMVWYCTSHHIVCYRTIHLSWGYGFGFPIHYVGPIFTNADMVP